MSDKTQAKVALVTGSSSGIGEATVKLLAKKGYKVAICGSKAAKVAKVEQECLSVSPQEHKPLGLVLDFSEPTNGRVAVLKTIEHFGRLDVLVNNAGIFIKTNSSDSEVAYEEYRNLMRVNLDATVAATLAAQDELVKNRGNLVFVSSVASIKASERGYSYCMSKAAMSMYAKCLAIDLAPYVRVNVVSPGPVATPIFERIGLNNEMSRSLMSNTTLHQRIGEPDEVANVIYFLVSDQATFVYGHELFVDGGYLLKPSSSAASQQILPALKDKAAQ